MKTELLLENKNWFTFRLIDFENDFIVVINKKAYFNPPKYNSVVGRYFSNSTIPLSNSGSEVEKGSFITEQIDNWFSNTLDKSS